MSDAEPVRLSIQARRTTRRACLARLFLLTGVLACYLVYLVVILFPHVFLGGRMLCKVEIGMVSRNRLKVPSNLRVSELATIVWDPKLPPGKYPAVAEVLGDGSLLLTLTYTDPPLSSTIFSR